MNIDQLLSGKNESLDIGSQITSSITDMLAPILWLSVVLTIIFIALYISSILRRRKVENAIIDIQKMLAEMNERDKMRQAPIAPAPRKENETIIAKTDSL